MRRPSSPRPARLDANNQNAAGTGTGEAVIVKSTPLNVAKLVGLINSSAITSFIETARLVNTRAPPEPDNKSNGEEDVNESEPDRLPPVKTVSFKRIFQSEFRLA